MSLPPEIEAVLGQIRDMSTDPGVTAEIDQTWSQIKSDMGRLLAYYSEADRLYADGRNDEAFGRLAAATLLMASMDRERMLQAFSQTVMAFYGELRHKWGGQEGLRAKLESVPISNDDLDDIDPADSIFAPPLDWPSV